MNKVHFGTLTNQTLEFKLISCPKLFKNLHATLDGYTRIKPIKRTRKRQIAKAKHMMAWHDHASYEWSQWWKSNARKPKRWKRWKHK
ncbi:hypothetical protein GIX81_03450 [Lactobacillus reuteri]|uniref:Uncharacterized protein n=1 Tax=Limosilactobacillus reuteri TaxID=1598 RepID=A0A6L5P219_LIMRT|nr:hypothetical protein [Limosilactobacillus reuteri]MRH08465.1 hypothetical protein [Limosilactobacillus reuteri]MRH08515.1 hypothetical protein [Limosilactobacillus reuteri]